MRGRDTAAPEITMKLPDLFRKIKESRWLTAFFMAWGMFLYIPCPVRRWDESLRREMLLAFPFTGLISGGLWAFLGVNACGLLPAPAAAGILCVLPWFLTGFMHLDGFMDVSDAVFSCRDPERRREILKDPHTGAFAVILMVVLALLQWSFCLAAAAAEKTFPAASLLMVSTAVRAVCAYGVLSYPPMETSQYAGLERTGKEGFPAAVTAVLAVFADLILFKSDAAAFAAAACFLALCFGRRNLGGMNGDVSGFALSIGECAGILFLVPGML